MTRPRHGFALWRGLVVLINEGSARMQSCQLLTIDAFAYVQHHQSWIR